MPPRLCELSLLGFVSALGFWLSLNACAHCYLRVEGRSGFAVVVNVVVNVVVVQTTTATTTSTSTTTTTNYNYYNYYDKYCYHYYNYDN